MADIQWPSATYWNKAWNPIIGCKPCSPACDNCYARALATRFNKSFAPHPSAQKRPPRSGVVFCGNMTDLFGEWRSPMAMFNDVDKVMHGRNQTGYYLWLTKRVCSMCNVLNTFTIRAHKAELLFNNHYFGFTAESQEWYDRRCVPYSSAWPKWAKLWLSLEPLLCDIDLGFPMMPHLPSWVVVGCESGPHRRPCKLEWVEAIVDQCLIAGVPVFVKQLDINGKCERDITKFPKRLQYRQVPWIQTRRTP